MDLNGALLLREDVTLEQVSKGNSHLDYEM
jgi:hypothetical protein